MSWSCDYCGCGREKDHQYCGFISSITENLETLSKNMGIFAGQLENFNKTLYYKLNDLQRILEKLEKEILRLRVEIGIFKNEQKERNKK